MADIGNIFDLLGTHWIAKALLAAIALKAVFSLVQWRRCAWTATKDLAAEGAEAIEARRSALWNHSYRFLLVMFAGIGLAIWGLLKIAHHGAEAPLGLLVLTLGVYLFLTEPVQRQIADAEDRAALAALRTDAEGQALAVDMVRGNRLNLVLIDVTGALVLGFSILALSGVPIPM